MVCMLASSMLLLLLPGVACGGCSEGGGSMMGKGVDVDVNVDIPSRGGGARP